MTVHVYILTHTHSHTPTRPLTYTHIHTHTHTHTHPQQQVKNKTTTAAKISHLQERLRIGWGTARVAVGMAVTSHVYEWCKTTQEEAAAIKERIEGDGEEIPCV
jgi:hypothetical protein